MSADEAKDLTSPQPIEEKHPELNAVQQAGYDSARAALIAAAEQGYIDLSNVHRILDFGAGLGGPTLGIIDATRQYNPNIDAVEKEEIWINILTQLGILPLENIIHNDGISYLRQLAQKGIAPYDLITAFRLGPDGQGRIFREIASASATALNPTGNLLVTSDNNSMHAALKACEDTGVPYYFIDEITGGSKIVRPYILVVPQSSCARIQPLVIPASF